MSKARTELKVQKKGAITGERMKLSEQQQTGTQYRTECGIYSREFQKKNTWNETGVKIELWLEQRTRYLV